MCLEKAVERFLDSGVANDAFDVYFCYLEMFVGEYGKSRRMVEMLSDFENNSSSLLMKHRDHYSHSVYVFILGLAIYETNSIYRDAYMKYYNIEDCKKAAHHYLQYWGLTSLFHDIGYPFELPFEQVASYFEVNNDNRKNRPFLAYNNLESYTTLDEQLRDKLFNIYGKKIETTDDIFAYNISCKLSEKYHFSKDGIKRILKTKPINPDLFGFYMDHAYFSATILFKELFSGKEVEKLSSDYIEAMTAIILHNSLYKFSIAFYKEKKLNVALKMEDHPLTYMLILCDELQVWDRISYGRNSRKELHPFGCKINFNDNGIQAVYLYDIKEKEKIDDFHHKHEKYCEAKAAGIEIENEKPKLKAYSDMINDNEFKSNIEAILDLSEIKLDVSVELLPVDYKNKNTYLSDANFIHLYDFAVALNAQYENNYTSLENMEASFNKLSLEYKLSNILQAKSFAKHLNAIDCFYTDRPVAYEIVEKFDIAQLNFLGEKEHERWENEKRNMSWLQASEDEYKLFKNNKEIREQLRMHNDLGVLFRKLSDDTQMKDIAPLNTMLDKIKEFDGLRIYKLI